MGHMGSMALAGTVDGKRISFAIEMQGGQKIVFSGVINGTKMTGTHGPRRRRVDREPRMTRALILCAFASALGAQTAKPVLGTVTGFKPFEILLKSDSGEKLPRASAPTPK